MRFKNANKLLKREIERFRHSIIAIRLRDGTIVGNNTHPLDHLEWMYVRYGIDPFMGDRVKKSFKEAIFDISFPNKDLHFECIHIRFSHFSRWYSCHLDSVDTEGRWIDLPAPVVISIFDYITGEMKLIPHDDVSKKALKYLDQFITRSACDFMFHNDMWIPDDDVKRLKKEISDTFLNPEEEEKNEQENQEKEGHTEEEA